MKFTVAMDQLLLKDGRGPEFTTHDVEYEEEETNASQNLSCLGDCNLSFHFPRLLHMELSENGAYRLYTPKLVVE